MILFSTIYLTTYNSLYDQADMAYKGMNLLNGQKVTDKFFQKIEADLLGQIMPFDAIQSTYNNQVDSVTIGDFTYFADFSTTPCTMTGADTTTADPEFIRIDISIWAVHPNGDTLWIGTQEHPLSKVFVDLYI